MFVFKKFLLVLYAIIFFLVFSSFWGFYISIKPQKIISSITPKNLGLNYENVDFTTTDDVNIKGWFLPHQNKKAKTIVLLHGYPADKGDILPSMAFLAEKYNLLLFDFRYLGESGGKYSTAGAKETEDLLAAIRFLKSRGIEQVGVWGFSVGGAVALMTAPRAPEIKVIVSESSYAQLDLLAFELYRLPVLKYPVGYLIGLWSKIILSIDLKNISPANAAKNINIPLLIIHSQNDEVISFKHGLLLRGALKNNPRAEFWFDENLIHGQFGQEYQKRIGGFFEKNL